MNLSYRNISLFVFLIAIVFGAVMLQGVEQPENSQEEENLSDFNRADLMFMNMMIIHHDQAIEMAELAPERTDNENILALSENISEAQRRENEKMASWLQDAGFRRPVDGHRMAGMASEQEMEELRSSEGREFDVLFSRLMIEHHRGGIQMARGVVQNGNSEKVSELAQEMIRVQQEEIQKMEEWRENWS